MKKKTKTKSNKQKLDCFECELINEIYRLGEKYKIGVGGSEVCIAAVCLLAGIYRNYGSLILLRVLSESIGECVLLKRTDFSKTKKKRVKK